MTTFLFDVTQDDIDETENSGTNPIEVAIRRTIPGVHSVDIEPVEISFYLPNDGFVYDGTSGKTADFIDAFNDGDAVKPFSFEFICHA